MELIEDPPEGTNTLFGIFRKPFPSDSCSKINTKEFLEATKGVVLLIDKLGKIFAPVKYDMNGNITKLANKFRQNEEAYTYLEDMILSEKEEGNTNKTIEALQWLCRGLHFLLRFFEQILEDKKKREDQTVFLKRAYEETLESYHGWMGAQLFGIMSRFAPSRKDLFFILAYDTCGKDEVVQQEMTNFVCHLSACVKCLIKFYKEHNLETYQRV